VNPELLRSYCLSKGSSVTEGFPFGENVLVFKAAGKVFALFRLNVHPVEVNLKCDPELAVELRERHAAIRPGYHMNKRHWNTVILDGSLPSAEIRSMIDHSYGLVLPAKSNVRRKKQGSLAKVR